MSVEPQEAPATTVSDVALLHRHRPILLWDSQDDFRAMAADSIAENPGNVLEAHGRVVAGARGEGGVDLSLSVLSGKFEGDELDSDSRFKQAPFPFVAARRIQQEPAYANRIYGRIIHRPQRVYLQYWMWLYYNPKNLLGFGRHEGDWEMVQVALIPRTLEPVGATYAQHGRGEHSDDLSDWKPCERPCSDACRHPEVYVAPFSHASYFERGTHFYSVGTDNPDGTVREELPEVVLLDGCPWKDWPGRWGQQQGALPSPKSPGCQPAQWDPETFERKARARKPLEERLSWRAGSRTYPEVPTIETAFAMGDAVQIKWRVRRKLGLRPQWLLFTIQRGEPPHAVVRRRMVRVTGSAGTTRIPLLQPPSGPLIVKASAFNRLRQRSDASAPREVGFAAAPNRPEYRDDFKPAVLKAFHRELLRDLTDHGAATLAELNARKMSVLELPLDQHELKAVVDSARRAGLVEPLDHQRRADGSAIDDPEWGATEEGRGRIMTYPRWLFRILSAVPLAGLVAAAIKLGPEMKKLGPNYKWVGVALPLLLLALILGRLLYQRTRGATDRTVAAEWSRHAVELPRFNRYLTWWTRGRLLAASAGIASFVVSQALFPVFYKAPAAVTALGVIAITLVYLAALLREGQLDEARREAKALREDSGPTPLKRAAGAVGELKASKRRRRRKRRSGSFER